jgi:hypothetical protein
MDAVSGEAGGGRWRSRAQHGAVPLRPLQRGTPLPERRLLLGVGGLAREERLHCIQKGRRLTLVLTDQQEPWSAAAHARVVHVS